MKDLPPDWLRRRLRYVKNSLRTLCPFFNTNRMVEDYIRKAYVPSHNRHEALHANNQRAARDLSAWRSKVEKNWPGISISQLESTGTQEMLVGKQLDVKAAVVLGDLTPSDVDVQLIHGQVDALGQFVQCQTVTMHDGQRTPLGAHWYQGSFTCQLSGQYGYAVRVLPRHEHLAAPLTSGLLTWNT